MNLEGLDKKLGNGLQLIQANLEKLISSKLEGVTH